MSVFTPSFVDGLHEGSGPGPWISLHFPYDEHVEVDHVNGLFSAGLQNSICDAILACSLRSCFINFLTSSRVGVLGRAGSEMCESEMCGVLRFCVTRSASFLSEKRVIYSVQFSSFPFNFKGHRVLQAS